MARKRRRKKMKPGTLIHVGGSPSREAMLDPFHFDDQPSNVDLNWLAEESAFWDTSQTKRPRRKGRKKKNGKGSRTATSEPFLGLSDGSYAPEPESQRPPVPAWTKDATRLPERRPRGRSFTTYIDNRDLSGMPEDEMEETRTPATLTGMALGDALGRPFEFCRDATQLSEWSGELIDGGWGLRTGQYTDDTKMGLCIAESLLDVGAFDYADIGNRYMDWVESGDTRGMGGTCSAAIHRMRDAFQDDHLLNCGRNTGQYCGNGTAMRIAPLGVFYRNELDEMLSGAHTDAILTHRHWDAVESSQALCVMIASLVNGEDPLVAVLKGRDTCDPAGHVYNMIDMAVTCVNEDRFPWHVSVGGRADATMCTAVWAFLMYRESFEKALDTSVRMGGDADTRGAITGALAGAYHGREGIPERWLSALEDREHLARLDWQLMYGEDLD